MQEKQLPGKAGTEEQGGIPFQQMLDANRAELASFDAEIVRKNERLRKVQAEIDELNKLNPWHKKGG